MRKQLIPFFLIFLISAAPNVLADDSSSGLGSDLSTLETRFFEHAYVGEPDKKRLDRLEELVFGTTRSGSDQERLSRLLLAVPNLPASQTASAPEPQEKSPENSPEETGDNATSPSAIDNKGEQTPDQYVPSQDYYPSVTALEEEILGKTYRKLPIDERVAQLEVKAFGKTSNLSTLQNRVDALKQYVAEKNGNNEDYLSAPAPALSWKSHPPSLLQELDQMEKQVFGHTYARDDLMSRINRLEDKVFPQQTHQTFTPITIRIDRLKSALEVPPESHIAGSEGESNGNAPASSSQSPEALGQIQPFTDTTQPSQNGDFSSSSGSEKFGQIEPMAQPSTSQPSVGFQPMPEQTSNQAQHQTQGQGYVASSQSQHPFLHKLGSFLGALGSIAATGLTSLSYGNYYGGYGYPGMGIGNYYGGYGYPGGYGYSPFGLGSSMMYGRSPMYGGLGYGMGYGGMFRPIGYQPFNLGGFAF